MKKIIVEFYYGFDQELKGTVTDKPDRLSGWRGILKAMKISTAFILVGVMHVSASGVAQKISFTGENVSLTTVFNAIEDQLGFGVLMPHKLMESSKPVTVKIKNGTLDNLLQKCFEFQPWKVSYTLTGHTIYIAEVLPAAVQAKDIPPSKNVKVIGTVYNEAGEPLSGANVTIKETQKGTITNSKGEFNLGAIPTGNTIIFSFIGYARQEMKVSDVSNVKIYLKITKNELDKVVIQAYGTTSQRLTTGDIGTVTAAEIEKQPVINPLLTLQGRIAGLDVTQTSGYASAPIKVELRGRNAISSQFTSDPLYIIDGVPLTVLEVSGNSSYATGSYGFLQSGIGGPANGQSPFFNINPADIESITVLKDADATAIYGSRGANGVILITTKKGKPGRTQFDLHVYEGINKVTKYWNMMNTPQYLAMREEAYRNDGLPITLSNGAYDLIQWDTTRYTNWQKALYGGTGRNIDVQAAISGGDLHTTFRIGAGYTRTTNILTVTGADQRASVMLSLAHHSTDQHFIVTAATGFSFTQTDMISLPQNAVLLPPDAPAIYDSARNLNYSGWGDPNTTSRGIFPFSGLLNPYSSKTNFLNSNISLNYQPFKGLKANVSLGYNNGVAIQQQLTTIASQDPLSSPTGTAQFGNNRNTNWIVEPNITYDAFMGKGKFDLLVGGSVQQANTDGEQDFGVGYSSDELLRSISNAPQQYSLDNSGEYRYAAIFGRINYNWENKYILNLNARRDGSSRFGPDKQYGNFGSAGVAWIFTEEEWIKGLFKFLSFGKLRGSYGTTGSDAVGDYAYLTRWTSAGLLPYEGFQPLVPTQHADPNYQWQVNKKLEAAIDLGVFHDRGQLTVAFYRDRCGNQLVQFPTPVFTGFGSVAANSPALVQNEGWEFTANAKILDTRNFSWTINFNIAVNTNKLVAYPHISQSPYAATLIVGQALNIVQELHYIGVNPQTGQYSFEDKNHDGQITLNAGSPNSDMYPYNLSPKFLGGGGMNFGYGNLLVSLFFNFKDQLGVNAYAATSKSYGPPINAPTEIIGKEWKNPGDIATIAKFTNYPNNSLAGNSDLAYTDASFFRLSSLSLSYGLPMTYVKKMGMQACDFFIHTNNIFVITKYKGLDPETQNFGGMPPNKTWVGGISFTF